MSELDNATLDLIELSNGDVHRGIVDYSNQKFVHFYNFSDEVVSPDLVLIAIAWKLRHQHLRFSVYCSIHFPMVELPRINIINRKGIEKLSNEGVPVAPLHKVKRRITT